MLFFLISPQHDMDWDDKVEMCFYEVRSIDNNMQEENFNYKFLIYRN